MLAAFASAVTTCNSERDLWEIRGTSTPTSERRVTVLVRRASTLVNMNYQSDLDHAIPVNDRKGRRRIGLGKSVGPTRSSFTFHDDHPTNEIGY